MHVNSRVETYRGAWKQVYDLIEESMDAYLSSLTVQMLLDCARNGDNSRTFLAERLQEESRRLLDAVK